MAFIQVLCLGMAVAMRLDRIGTAPREVVREVVRYLPADAGAPAAVATPEPGGSPDEGPVAIPEVVVDEPVAEPSLATLPRLPPPPPGLALPVINDPVVAQLVAEARHARIAGDMRAAMTKLQEAESLAPEDANVLYESGLAYEVMEIFDRASSYYQRVYELGTTGAGSLYEVAAKKISVGFAQPEDQRGRLGLGRARIFKESPPEGGQRVVVTIPVFGAPGEDFVPDDLAVKVTFFDQDQDLKIVPLSAGARTQDTWVTAPVDWAGQGEELLQITYEIPPPSLQDAHLFGTRTYYGQVVELFYKGELIDSQAWPRHLAQKMNSGAPSGLDEVPMFLDENSLPLDYNRQNPLLPLPVR
jgi:hypothetical protein